MVKRILECGDLGQQWLPARVNPCPPGGGSSLGRERSKFIVSSGVILLKPHGHTRWINGGEGSAIVQQCERTDDSRIPPAIGKPLIGTVVGFGTTWFSSSGPCWIGWRVTFRMGQYARPTMSKNTDTIHPTSFVGIKRLAKTVAKEQNLHLYQAQNLVAQRVGFSNFSHAQKYFAQGLPAPMAKAPVSTYRVTISAAWRDTGAGLGGTEEWWVDLSEPLAHLLSSTQMLNSSALGDLWAAGSDDLHFTHSSSSQGAARSKICKALRTLSFCDATKLRPSSARQRIHPKSDLDKAIPGKDHYTAWFDPATKAYVMVDEPYIESVKRLSQKRADWAKEHEFLVIQPSWQGMYNPSGPSGSCMFLVAHKNHGALLARAAKALAALPSSITTEHWAGKSLQRTLPKPAAPAAALKPDAVSRPRMSIPLHQEVGAKLQEVLGQVWRRDGVYKPLEEVRNTLDNWVQREYTVEELPMDIFGALYFGRTGLRNTAKALTEDQRANCIQRIQEVKTTLSSQYGSFATGNFGKQLDKAMKALHNWR